MIIGLSGNNGSGKTTFGRALGAEFLCMGFSVRVCAFADPLYDICTRLYGLQPKQFYDEYPEEKIRTCRSGFSVRDTLNNVGAALRATDSDIFVNALKADVEITIVTDVRFANEAGRCDKVYAIIRKNATENVGVLLGHDGLIENDRDVSAQRECAVELAHFIANEMLVKN